MNAVPSSIKAPSEPQVNLLPPEVEARRARGRQKGAIAFFFVVFLLLLGFAAYWVSVQEGVAQDELTKVTDEGARLQAEIDTYQYVVDMEAELDTVRAARRYVGSTEVDFFDIIVQVVAALPPGVVLEDLTWTTMSVAASSPLTVDPLATPDVGSVEVRGRMNNYVAGADLEEAFEEVPFLERVRIFSIQAQQGEGGANYYVYEGTARVNALAFTGRFSSTWLVANEIDRAQEAVEQRLEDAKKTLDAAKAAEESGEAGAGEARTEAQAAYDLALDDRDQMLAIAQLVIDMKGEIAAQQDAVAYGVAGAAEALLAAEAELQEAEPVLNTLAQVINAWDEDAENLATVEARIAAAEKYVTLCEEKVAIAEEAVTTGVEGADDALEEAQTLLMKAEYGLNYEQSTLTEAQEAESATRATLDEALVAAAAIAPVPDSTGGEES